MPQAARQPTAPAMRPEPFRWEWLAPRFWPTWLGLGAFALFSLLPGRLRRRLGELAGSWVYRSNYKRRRYVQINLGFCFPHRGEAEREQLGIGYFRSLLRCLADYGVLWWGPRRAVERLVRLEGAGYLDACLEANRPVILLTGHTVGVDMGAAALGLHYPVVGMVNKARNPLGDWIMAKGRTRFRALIIRRQEGLRPAVRFLKAGNPFYYAADEDLGPENSEFLPFFGVPAATITALPRLARLTGAVVLPFVTAYRIDEDRYVTQIFPALEDFPSGDDVVDAARMNKELETLILLAPEQYMWSMRLFKTRPPGEPNPYKGLSRRKRKRRNRNQR